MERFQIVIKDRIDKEWGDWFGDIEIRYQDDSTVLTGELPDQSALHGILSQIRDLNLTLISVSTYKQNQ